MSEEKIRLDQTKRVFDTLAELISKNETCTYRHLIYDLLGFDGYYSTLISGLTITNALVEKEDLQQRVEQLENIIKEAIKYLKKREFDNYSCSVCSVITDDLLKILYKGAFYYEKH